MGKSIDIKELESKFNKFSKEELIKYIINLHLEYKIPNKKKSTSPLIVSKAIPVDELDLNNVFATGQDNLPEGRQKSKRRRTIPVKEDFVSNSDRISDWAVRNFPNPPDSGIDNLFASLKTKKKGSKKKKSKKKRSKKKRSRK